MRELKGMREEAFSRTSDHCMSDVNVVRKRAGTILNDGINKYHVSFFLWLQFGNLIVTLYSYMSNFMGRRIHNTDINSNQIVDSSSFWDTTQCSPVTFNDVSEERNASTFSVVK
jgi:hypothetical protein